MQVSMPPRQRRWREPREQGVDAAGALSEAQGRQMLVPAKLLPRPLPGRRLIWCLNPCRTETLSRRQTALPTGVREDVVGAAEPERSPDER